MDRLTRGRSVIQLHNVTNHNLQRNSEFVRPTTISLPTILSSNTNSNATLNTVANEPTAATATSSKPPTEEKDHIKHATNRAIRCER